MAENTGLSELLAREKFEHIARVFRKHFALGLETTGRDGEPVESLCSADCRPEFCRLVQQHGSGRQRCSAERRRAVEIAAETGQSYITLCHAGIVLVCVPIVDRDTVHGGMFFGKCLWEPVTALLLADIESRLQKIEDTRRRTPDGGGTDAPSSVSGPLSSALRQLPVVRGPQIHRAAEFLFDLLYEVGGFDARAIRWRRQRAEQQSEIGEFIRAHKKLGAKWQYPLQSERALLQKVKIGDRTGAKEILNSILGTILFKDIGDLGILKARLLELLSVLSRAAVEGGVDIDTMLEKNLAYVNKVMQIDNQEDLCAWISAALNEFLELVYSSQDARKMTQLRPAIAYIDAHCDQPLTLAEIAKASHLSVSRLAHVFKEQMGVTPIDYLTSLRIERAKELLLGTDQSCTEICFQAGYNHQSYFTRTFKSLVGMTPRQFRTENRRKVKFDV
ncbi:MAG: helix-turn-helix domain-containing protein [Planctomycetes bacterium]|jgi:two-component system response regulator YesN|nr:helix-turn-helix domain-containing protein [Planctomycetota bacterium]